MTEEEERMFIRLSNAYWGKQYYFQNKDGTFYSRYSNKDLTPDEATIEFERELMGNWK